MGKTFRFNPGGEDLKVPQRVRRRDITRANRDMTIHLLALATVKAEESQELSFEMDPLEEHAYDRRLTTLQVMGELVIEGAEL
jgi:hypothetical protein